MQHSRIPYSPSLPAAPLTVDGLVARLRRAMDDARRMRDAIVLMLGLLGDLDDLTPDEPDRSAFEAMAGLFQDIVDFAAFAAVALRRAAGQGDVL